ncbi:MAG: hypothetical protein ABH871_09390 [Pseudomonadota bacterium]
MKKILMLVLAIAILTAVAIPKSFAEDVDEECACGTDETGECLPCEEE